MAVSEILEKYIASLNEGNADKVAELFDEECDFMDGGARLNGFSDLVASGRENVRSAFSGVFSAYPVSARIVRLNPNSMEYDVTLGNVVIPCIGAVTCGKNGLIKEYIVRPR